MRARKCKLIVVPYCGTLNAGFLLLAVHACNNTALLRGPCSTGGRRNDEFIWKGVAQGGGEVTVPEGIQGKVGRGA